MQFESARCLVTGGGTGIGRAIAEGLIARGARVAIMGRRSDVLAEAAAAIGALAISGDVSVEADAVRAVDTVVREFGGIDLLVNNAATWTFTTLVETDLEAFRRVFAVNVTGAMLMTREVARHFTAQKSGHVVNISSTSGLRGGARGTAYSGSKFALRGMTECWREELRRHNVRVMLVSPSEVQTGFVDGKEPADPNPKKLVARDIADAVMGALAIDDRGFVPEFAVFATNPF